jgi:hypothetical protein
MTTNLNFKKGKRRIKSTVKKFNPQVDVINSQLADDILKLNGMHRSLHLQKKVRDEVSSNETLHVSENSERNVNMKEDDLPFASLKTLEILKQNDLLISQLSKEFNFFSRPSIVDQINLLKFPTSFTCKQNNCNMSFITELNLKRHVVLEHLNCGIKENINSINLICNKCVQEKMCMFLFTDLHEYLTHYRRHESKEFCGFINHIFVDLNREVDGSNFMMLGNNDILSKKYSFVVKRNEIFEINQMLARLRTNQGLDTWQIEQM